MLRVFKLLIAVVLTIIITVLIQENIIVQTISKVIGVIIWLGILTSDLEFYFKSVWLIIILVNPFAGVILYIAFGLDYRSNLLFNNKVKKDAHFEQYIVRNESYNLQDKWQRIMHNLGGNKIYQNSKLKLLENGEVKFKDLFEQMRLAQEYIHLEYYLIHNGQIKDELFDILIEKAREGIKCRVLCDGLGAFDITTKEMKEYRKLGIEIYKFGDIRNPLFNEKVNIRNHRKIAIIDGRVAYVGGINIGDEYVYETEKYGVWHDTHLRVEGDGIYDLQLTFLRDWHYQTGEDLIIGNPHYIEFEKIVNESLIQIIPSGPDHKKFAIKDLIFKLMTSAEREITIMTPYLVPDFDIVRAMITASKNGVDVHLIVPGNPDRKIVGVINRSYYSQLLKAGIKIYEVNSTFVHSKVMIVDQEIAMIGTTNLDFRSFNLNFEITSFIKDVGIISELTRISEEDFANSQLITNEMWQAKHNIAVELVRKTIQLFAPFF